MPDNAVNTIITSPPYWGLRDYGDQTKTNWVDGWHGQLGLEPTLKLYHSHLLQITSELKRVLRPDGVMFWNHGDSYATQSGSGKIYENIMPGYEDKAHSSGLRNRKLMEEQGIPRKSLFLQNYRLILKMIDDQGWILRNTIIWHKPNHMPSSVTDRFTNAYEPVFMLTKNQCYCFDLDAVREPHLESSIERYKGKYTGSYNKEKSTAIGYKESDPNRKLPAAGKNPGDVWKEELNNRIITNKEFFNTKGSGGNYDYGGIDSPDSSHNHPSGKNPGDLWKIPTYPFPGAHFAVFPPALIRKPILAGCPEGGTILDPFGGSGTVAIECEKLKRNSMIIDINKEYCEMAYNRLKPFVDQQKIIGEQSSIERIGF